MDYKKFCEILNKHIFEGEKKDLLKNIADRPERFLGLFRPTKPSAKVLQHLLQSHEIRMGDALENIIEEILRENGFTILPKNIENKTGERLSLDHYFTDGKTFYFIEQKIRDDHDSTKKRGQLNNFEAKVNILIEKHKDQLVGIMYFIDPDLSKNKNYYLKELNRLSEFYGVELYLFYGKDLFKYLNCPNMWDNIIIWLRQWKDGLPELPEINFDATPQESFEELKNLELRYWRKILENETLWKEGIMKAIFRDGSTLKLLFSYFSNMQTTPYRNLKEKLADKLNRYYDFKVENK